MSRHEEEGNGSTDRNRKDLPSWPESEPSVIPRDKLGSPAWLGKPCPCSWLFLLLPRPLSLGSEVFGAWEKENLRAISSVSGPSTCLRGNCWVVSALQMWLKLAGLKIKLK